jgi:hypothetical protein
VVGTMSRAAHHLHRGVLMQSASALHLHSSRPCWRQQ